MVKSFCWLIIIGVTLFGFLAFMLGLIRKNKTAIGSGLAQLVIVFIILFFGLNYLGMPDSTVFWVLAGISALAGICLLTEGRLIWGVIMLAIAGTIWFFFIKQQIHYTLIQSSKLSETSITQEIQPQQVQKQKDGVVLPQIKM